MAADKSYSPENSSREGYAANIFTAESDEQLEAVSFYTTDVNTQYQISVYTGSSEEKPSSGELAYSGKTGCETFAGYHTIELENPVKLQKGTNFTIVVKLSNPEYYYPIAVDAAVTDVRKEHIEYSNSDNKSFISADGKNWTDVNEYSYYSQDENQFSHVIISNVCIKAFTNPLAIDGEAISNVRFSVLEGPVALDTELKLEGPRTINYQIDGGAIQTYNGAITIDKPCTITAWGVENGKCGNKVSRTYTTASAQLNELVVENGSEKNNVEINSDKTAEIIVTDPMSVRLCPRSSDSIKIDGKNIASDEWSEEFTLSGDETSKDIQIEVTAKGKTPTTYVVKIIAKQKKFEKIRFDYENETINFDENIYQLFDENENEIHSGSSVSDYSVLDDGVSEPKKFSIKDEVTGSLLGYINVPLRQATPTWNADFSNETTYETFNSRNVWSSSADDFKEIHICADEKIKLDSGTTYHLWRPADEKYGFASEAVVIEVAERPQSPKTETEIIRANYVKLKKVDGCEYRIAGDEWQDNPDFYGLDINTEYTFEIRVKGEYEPDDDNQNPLYTKLHYSSEVFSITLTTPDGIIVPYRYRYHGKEIIEFNNCALHIGKNEIDVLNDLFWLSGCVLADNQESVITVNVSEVNGELVPDKEIIVDIEMVNYDDDGKEIPVFAEDYKYTVIYWNADDLTQMIDSREFSFSKPYTVNNRDLSIPDGYVLADESESQENYNPSLMFYNGVWRAYNNCIYLAVRKAEEPAPPTTEEPEKPSTQPTTEEPEKHSTQPAAEDLTEQPEVKNPTSASAENSASEPQKINNEGANKPTDATSATVNSDTKIKTNSKKDVDGSIQTGGTFMPITVLIILISVIMLYFAFRRRT